jgi:hypothetical protein
MRQDIFPDQSGIYLLVPPRVSLSKLLRILSPRHRDRGVTRRDRGERNWNSGVEILASICLFGLVAGLGLPGPSVKVGPKLKNVCQPMKRLFARARRRAGRPGHPGLAPPGRRPDNNAPFFAMAEQGGVPFDKERTASAIPGAALVPNLAGALGFGHPTCSIWTSHAARLSPLGFTVAAGLRPKDQAPLTVNLGR